MKKVIIEKNDVILFDGDSITDALRDRNDKYSLAGYSKYIQETLECTCYNRGIGGDTSKQLLDRFEKDIIETNPTIISILIGVNDTWRRFDSNIIISPKETYDNVEEIIKIAKKYVNQIVILEPFLLSVDPNKMDFRKDIAERIWVMHDLAQKYKVVYIPLNGIFAEECCEIEPSVLSYDGVHPTDEGHKLIAKSFLARVSKIGEE